MNVSRIHAPCFWLFLLMFAMALPGQLRGQTEAESDRLNEDVYLSGATVESGEVEGDLVVAGGILNIVKPVSGDVMAAGAIVRITADTGDDIRAAGASVTIGGNVGDSVVAAGGSVTLDAGSTVGGDAWLAGSNITVAGNVRQGLMIRGEEVSITGMVGGDVEVYAGTIEVEPGAVIKGTLTYAAPQEVLVREGAVIEGDVNRQEFAFDDMDSWSAGLVGRLKFYFSLALAAIVLFLVDPRASSGVVQRLREAPLKSCGAGFVALTSVPILALILLFSGFGIPLALIALTLFGFALIAGLLFGIGWIGDTGMRLVAKGPDRSRWTRVWSVLVGAVLLMIIKALPYVGGWAFFLVLLLGIGALSLYWYSSLVARRSGPGAAA